jgi:hypothetical protein
LSMLLLKLIGHERLSQIQQYDTDRGFGVFAGLNTDFHRVYKRHEIRTLSGPFDMDGFVL